MLEEKKCKGINKAHGYESCGKMVKANTRKFGLCPSCFFDWMQTTEGGKIHYQKQFQPKVEKNIENKKKEERKKRTQEKRKQDSSSAMRLADMYFSRYIRLFYADLNGNCTCYTCGKIVPLKELDNGHYQKREHKATRYHLNNCRPQCKTCNGDTKHNGKQDVFRKNLVYEIGEEMVIEIENLAKSTFKTSAVWYREVSNKYRVKLNELQDKLKIKYW